MGYANDIQHWKCPVCLDVLFKPCVLRCGHVMCFWCMHFAMSPFTESRCPLCREHYVHLPQVCLVLHNFLAWAFPKEYQRRAEEITDDEERQGIQSLKLQASTLTGSASHKDTKLLPILEEFACSCRTNHASHSHSHSHVPLSPVVLNCGHVHCGLTTPAGLHNCASPWHVLEACQQCKAPILAAPAAVPQLDALVQELFPDQHRQRWAEVQASSWSPYSQTTIRELPAPEQAGADEQQKQTHPSSLPAVSGSDAADSTTATAVESPASAGFSNLRASLATAFTDRFVHYRVGCDSCGIYPIVGRRYRCRDCSERIGFDLCGACHDSQRNICGRFNQQHKPDHNMELVHNAPSLLHILQATNPGMNPEELRRLVAFGADGQHQADAVQRFLELPLTSASPGSNLPFGLQPETATMSSERSSGSGSRRRRASSSVEDGEQDAADIVNPPRRRRGNNAEAYVCILVPPTEAGQGAHVAVVSFSRSSASSDASTASTEGAQDGSSNSLTPPADTNSTPPSDPVWGLVMRRRERFPQLQPHEEATQAQAQTHTQQAPASHQLTAALGTPNVPSRDVNTSSQRQPVLRRLWSWALRRCQTSRPAPESS